MLPVRLCPIDDRSFCSRLTQRGRKSRTENTSLDVIYLTYRLIYVLPFLVNVIPCLFRHCPVTRFTSSPGRTRCFEETETRAVKARCGRSANRRSLAVSREITKDLTSRDPRALHRESTSRLEIQTTSVLADGARVYFRPSGFRRRELLDRSLLISVPSS